MSSASQRRGVDAIYLEKIDKQIVGATVEATSNDMAWMNMRPSNRRSDTVSKHLVTLLLAASILVLLNMTSAQASVVIDGVAYPDGCRKTSTTDNGLTSSQVVCPLDALDERVEAAKRISPPEMLGHSSNGNFTAQPAFQPPAECNAAIVRLSDTSADALYWFRKAIYETRELTAEAGSGVRDYIRTYSMRNTVTVY